MDMSKDKWNHILKYRILDIDTIAFILKNINVNAIVLGGSLDLRIYIYTILKTLLCKDSKHKKIIIIRDFEPHFVTLLIKIKNKKFDLIVFDSNPDFEPNGLKWFNLLKDIIINNFHYKFRIYMNIDRIQSDDISCKIFAINFASRLNKMNYKNIKKLCKNNILDYQKKEFKIFKLTSTFLKDTQSIKFLSNYFKQHDDIKLKKYIEKHSVSVFINGNNKIMNKSLDHKYINKYLPILQKFDINNCNKILYEYSGLNLINNIKIESYVTKIPIFPNPKESVYCEYLVPNRFKKIREYYIDYNTDYYLYRYNLIRYYNNHLFEIWKHKNLYSDDSDFDINNLIYCLDRGISQLLYAYIYVYSLIK